MAALAFAAAAAFTAAAQSGVAADGGQAPQSTLFGSANTDKKNPKYLSGAVPEVNGRVVFTTELEAPGKTAVQVCEAVAAELSAVAAEQDTTLGSKVSPMGGGMSTAVGRMSEWLVFRKSALSLDRTVFHYTIVAECRDGGAKLTMSNISYEYEADRGDGGMVKAAEDWITDEWGLTGNKKKLAKYSGKFRRGTIDRKDELFGRIAAAVKK